MKIPAIKIDDYSKARKSYSQIYALHCSKCSELLSYYQKDGKGSMNRIYLDRISNEQLKANFRIDEKLLCPRCNSMLGLGYIYQKEQRPAYKLFEREIYKKPISLLANIKFILHLIITR